MCGIFGQVAVASVDPAILARSTTLLRHRGPDDEGYLLYRRSGGLLHRCAGPDTDPRLRLPAVEQFDGQRFDVAFGFRRLSILDLSPAGHQPMSSHDGRYWIVFNGEIYNYVELRQVLIGRGHQFSSSGDTEVILAAYAEWGTECVHHFTGMWAFVILDLRDHVLFMSRDRFGIKPLYYIQEGRSITFSSEIKAFTASPGFRPRAHAAAAYDYLRFGLTDHAGFTLFEGVRQLQPAHYAIVSLSDPKVEPVCYWDVNTNVTGPLSFPEAATRLRELFEESVHVQLRSDVPVGAALSGGIDSSAIVMTMRRVAPALDLHTFSFIADDPQVSEERWVDLVATEAKATVAKVRPVAEELVADLRQFVSIQDEPFGSTRMYAQYRVFQLARRSGITVVLDGQGADEYLGGYRMYLADRLASLFAKGHFIRAAKLARHALQLPDSEFVPLILGAGSRFIPTSLQSTLRGFVGKELMPVWLRNSWFERNGFTPASPVEVTGPDYLKKHLKKTLMRTSLPMLLRYQDRSSMAHSVESRVPFLTAPVVEHVMSLPESYIIDEHATTKAVFRAAMRGTVPSAILDRRDKVGFTTPEVSWLSTVRPWIQRTLRSDVAESIPVVDHAQMNARVSRALNAGQRLDSVVWRWLNVVMWADNFQVRFDH